MSEQEIAETSAVGESRTRDDEPRAKDDEPRAKDEHLADVEDGCGCTEVWEHLSENRDD